MKTKSNFITGMAFGLMISTVSFLLISATERANNPAPEGQEVNRVQDVDSFAGGFITETEAAPLISAYKTNFVEFYRLPPNTTTGGLIGVQNLNQVIADAGENQFISFKFYLQTNQDGTKNIGLILVPTEGTTSVYRTGTTSFCPPNCTPPY